MVPLEVGKVILVLVPLPFKVREPPMVVLAFFKMVRALLLAPSEVPFPTTKSRSVDVKLDGFPVPIVAQLPKTISEKDCAVFKYPPDKDKSPPDVL